MQAHSFKCSHTLHSAFVIVFLGIFVIVFVFIEKDFLFDMFTFIAWGCWGTFVLNVILTRQGQVN